VNRKHLIDYVKKDIESYKYKLLSTEYKNALTKLRILCSVGHVFEMRYNNFQRGNRCPECYSNSKYLEYKSVKEYIECNGYKLLSTIYKSSKDKLELQCSENHIYKASYNHFQQGRRCPECSSVLKWSKPEKEIAEYVKENYSGDVVENDRTQIKNFWTGKNLELDIFLPELSKAIEFNGTWWHSNDTTKWYDEMKQKQCIQKGINLLVIEDKDWYNDKLCCLNKINELIGVRCLI